MISGRQYQPAVGECIEGRRRGVTLATVPAAPVDCFAWFGF